MMMSYDDIDVSLVVYGQTLRCCCCCLRLNNVHHVGPVVDMSGPAIDLRGESVYEAATDRAAQCVYGRSKPAAL